MGAECKLSAEAAARFVLGLGHSWTAEDVKRAYRRLALVYHPDKNPGKSAEEATERFQAVAKAKDLLLGLSQGAGNSGSSKRPQGYKHDSGTHNSRPGYKTSQAPPPFPAPPPPFPGPPRRFVPRERPAPKGKPAAPKLMAMWMCGACQLRDLGSESTAGTGRSVPCGRATPASRCFCGHTFEDHVALPGQGSDSEQRKLKCEHAGCLCGEFSYVPIGALCTCGHDSTVHDARPFHACSLPGCTCQTFHHAGMCACRHSWACHRTEIRTVTPATNVSRPPQPAWQSGGASTEEAESSPASGDSSTPQESSPPRSGSARPASAKASYAPYTTTPRSMSSRSRRPSSAGPDRPSSAGPALPGPNLNVRGRPMSPAPEPTSPGREGDLPAERSTTDQTSRAQPAATPSSHSKQRTTEWTGGAQPAATSSSSKAKPSTYCTGGTQPAAIPSSKAKQSTTGTQPAATSSSKTKQSTADCTGGTQSAATSTSNADTSRTDIPTNYCTSEASAATVKGRTRPSSAPPSRSAAAAGPTGTSSEASYQCSSSSARRSWTPQGLRPNSSGRSRPRPPFLRASTAGVMPSSAPSSMRRPPLPTGSTGPRAGKAAWAVPSETVAADQPTFAAPPPSTTMHEKTTERHSPEASAEKTADHENLKHNVFEEHEVDESSSNEPDEEPDTEPGESTNVPSPTGDCPPQAATPNERPTSGSRQRLWSSASSSSFARPAGAASEVASAAAAAAARAVSSDGRPWWERLHDPDKIHHSVRGPNRKPSFPPAKRSTSQSSSHMSATEVLYAAAASSRYPPAPRSRVRLHSASSAFRGSRASSAEREQPASSRNGQDAVPERSAPSKSTRPAPPPSRQHSQEESSFFQESYIYEDEGPSLVPETDGPAFFGMDSGDEGDPGQGQGSALSKNIAESTLDPQSAWQQATLNRLSELRRTLGHM